MSKLKEIQTALFGFMITILLGLISFIGDRQVSAIDKLTDTQQQHLREFAHVNSEVSHIKENINDIKNSVETVKRRSEASAKKVDKFIQRSYYYWPPREHEILEND